MTAQAAQSVAHATARRRFALLSGLGGATALLMAPALASQASAQSGQTAPAPGTFGAEPLPGSATALRGEMQLLLQEHTYLAGNTTDALLGDRQQELGAAAAGLNTNSSLVSRLLGSLYGPLVEARFQENWSRHINDYKLYTKGHLQGSDAQRQEARTDLEAFVQVTEGLLRETVPTLPAGVAANALAMHVRGSLEVIDAQAARDFPRVFTLAREGATMAARDLGDPLAVAIAQQFPQRFPAPTNGATPDAALDVRLLFQNHVYLASARTAALLDGRPEQAAGAGASLAANSQQIANRVSTALGAEAGQRFLALWTAHLDAFDAYATAAARTDVAARRDPASTLVRLAPEVDALLTSGAGGAGVRGQIATYLGPHVSYTLEAIDALAARDPGMAYGLTAGAARQVDEVALRVALALGPANGTPAA